VPAGIPGVGVGDAVGVGDGRAVAGGIVTRLDAEEKKRLVPRSPMAQAIAYVLNQWEALKVYVTQGRPSIEVNENLHTSQLLKLSDFESRR
jgi:hypothetical protein